MQKGMQTTLPVYAYIRNGHDVSNTCVRTRVHRAHRFLELDDAALAHEFKKFNKNKNGCACAHGLDVTTLRRASLILPL